MPFLLQSSFTLASTAAPDRRRGWRQNDGADEIPGIRCYRKWCRWRGDRGVGRPRDLRDTCALAARMWFIDKQRRQVTFSLARAPSLRSSSPLSYSRSELSEPPCVYIYQVSWKLQSVAIRRNEKNLCTFSVPNDSDKLKEGNSAVSNVKVSKSTSWENSTVSAHTEELSNSK